MKFIDNVRFMAGSVSSKCEICRSGFEYAKVQDSSTLIFKCLDCNKNYEQEFDEDLTKKIQKHLSDL